MGMWESHAAFERDFSKPLREATSFVAFRRGGIPQLIFFYLSLFYVALARSRTAPRERRAGRNDRLVVACLVLETAPKLLPMVRAT